MTINIHVATHVAVAQFLELTMFVDSGFNGDVATEIDLYYTVPSEHNESVEFHTELECVIDEFGNLFPDDVETNSGSLPNYGAPTPGNETNTVCRCTDNFSGIHCELYEGVCDVKCDTCRGPYDTDCVTCVINAHRDSETGACVCNDYWTGDACAERIYECAPNCLVCDEEGNDPTKCV